MNGVIGKFLLLCGLVTFVYAITPTLAWFGLFMSSAGIFVLADAYREKISREGLRSFIPKWMDDYLTREDMVDQLVHWIRDNGTISKIARLMVIKVLDLSRDELVEVISGVWPEYRLMSSGGHQTVTLMEIAPIWLRGMYLPNRKMLTSPSHDRLMVPGTDSNPLLSQISPPTPRTPSTSTLMPLVFWLAEKRIRHTMDVGVPLAGKLVAKSVGVSALLIIIWRRFPRARKSLKVTLSLLFGLYLFSITRGLPAFTDSIFKYINFTYYQTLSAQRRRREDRKAAAGQVPSGSFERVMFALLEPLIPTVNVLDEPPNYQSIQSCKPAKMSSLPPSSPSWSQASTLEPMNISVQIDE